MRPVCPDCVAQGVTAYRKPHPSATRSRCTTHHRAVTKARKQHRHEQYVKATYNLGEGAFAALKEFQGGRCAICRRATGASRELSVDHDHSCCSGSTSCGRCTRGVLCRTCNSMLGHARDEVAFFVRAVDYLVRPPFKRMDES